MPALTKDARDLKEAQARFLELEKDFKEANEGGNVARSNHEVAQKKIAELMATLGELRNKLAGASNLADERAQTISSMRDTIADLERMNGIQAGYIQRVNEDEYMMHNRDARRIGPHGDGIGRSLAADEYRVGEMAHRREYR